MSTKDLLDLDAADWLIMDNDGESTSGGQYVELGYALARGKRVTIVGKDNQKMFNSLASTWYESWEDLLQLLKKKKLLHKELSELKEKLKENIW